MEQSKALQRLIESADLLKMLEDIIGTGAIDRLSPASLSGMRLTLKGVRESVLSSHDALASDMIARTQVKTATDGNTNSRSIEVERSEDNTEVGFTRRDLRATIDKVREQQIK